MLEVTTKYALQALRVLERQEPGEFMRVKELSALARVPGPYLSKVMKVLAAKNLIVARRGINGGVRLAEGCTFTFYDVCAALEDPVLSQTCFFAKTPCSAAHPCAIHEKWGRLKGEIVHFLQNGKIRGPVALAKANIRNREN